MVKTSVLAAATICAVLGGTAYASAHDNNDGHTSADTQQSPAPQSGAQQEADKDFGRVSKDGFTAMHDVSMARWAIFNGDTNDAKLDIQKASAALGRAGNDDTVFMKAESDLTPPPGVTQPNPSHQQPDTKAVKWLPVDGAMSIDEDYAASPDKSAGVAKANKQLKSGDHKGAMDTLKLSGVNVTFSEAVVPLQTAVSGVEKAQTLLESGNFYEANQQLKSVQDAMRFDVADYSGKPKLHADSTAATHVASNGTGQESQGK